MPVTLDMDIAIHTENHPEVASRYNGLGLCYNDLKRYKEAIPNFEKALDVHLKAAGERHPKTPIRFTNLAECYKEAGRKKDARNTYEKFLKVAERIMDPRNKAYFDEIRKKIKDCS